MKVLGTIVNAAAIVIGAMIGILLKTGIPEKIKNTMMQGIGLSVIVIGLSMALKTENIIITIISLVLGDYRRSSSNRRRLEDLGKWIETKLGRGSTGDFKAFVTASLVYCIGAMAVMEHWKAGLRANTIYFTQNQH